MALLVTPRTQAECNQLLSALHSQGRNLFATGGYDPTIKVGNTVICWSGKDLHYAVRPSNAPLLDTLHVDKHVTVNELYAMLGATYHPCKLPSAPAEPKAGKKPITVDDIRVGLVVYPKDSYRYSTRTHTVSEVKPLLVDGYDKGEVVFEVATNDGCKRFSYQYVIDNFTM